jgi:hypothetical protein
MVVLQGILQVWNLNSDRPYSVASLSFGEALKALKSDPYCASTGKGEQRTLVPVHVRRLKKEILAGRFVPVPVHAGLRDRLRQALVFTANSVQITVDASDPLPLIDGGHRLAALGQILTEAQRAVLDAQTDQERQRAMEFEQLVLGQPITVIVHLDRELPEDFVRLQEGRRVDAAHIWSLKVQTGLTKDKERPVTELAKQVARILARHRRSPLYRMVRFDSRGTAPLPINSVCNQGVEAAGSLFGLGKFGLEHRWKPGRLAACVLVAYNAVCRNAPELTTPGMPLEPMPNGPRGATYLILGLAVALAYRCQALGHNLPTEDDLRRLVDAARRDLSQPIRWNASREKRLALGRFVGTFLADINEDTYYCIPLELIKLFAPSAYSLPPLPRSTSKPGPTAA